jgi:integration host factor subunit beta
MATRRDLVDKVVEMNPDVPRKDVVDAVDIVWGAIAEELIKDNRIEIRGFGAFSTRKRKLSANSSLPNRDASLGNKVIKSVYYRMSSGILSKINQ